MCFEALSRPISRRRLLAASGVALSVLVGRAGQARAQTAAIVPKPGIVGRSRGGQPITMYHFGDDRQRVLVLGGQHGLPEANTVDLANAILEYVADYPSVVPKGVGLDIITIANPDGYVYGSRQYLSGVDPNRNWASGDWEPDAYDSLGRFIPGLGGPAPMSEPETRQLAAWITRRRPHLVINYHSAGGFVTTNQDGLSWELAQVYADASGYPCDGSDAPFGYPITGAMDGWLAGKGIADLFVELSTLEDAEIDENLAGLLAVLGYLSQPTARYAPAP